MGNRSSKCDNKEVQRELGDEIYQSIECPRPEGLRCKMNKSPCAYPFYYKSLTFEESGEDEKIKKAKKILLEEIKKLYEKGENNGIYGRHNPHIKQIEKWIADLIVKKVNILKLYANSEEEGRRRIKIALGDRKLEIGADCILYCEQKEVLILVEFKGYFQDSNSIRSAILNAMLFKEGKIRSGCSRAGKAN